MSSCAIALHLRIRAKPENRERLVALLSEARPLYEQPGGVTMRLLEDRSDRNAFIEVFEYDSIATYEADDRRVREDLQQKAYIARWRSMLDGPPVVEVYAEQTIRAGEERAPTQYDSQA